MDWGLLGGERLGGERRVRALGLGATVRAFNELSVPGLGGVWYGRQIALALLGIHLAETVRRRAVSNIAAANAVEALAVWLAFKRHGWTRNPRLPGLQKLGRRKSERDPSFDLAKSRQFYVVQPMRIGTRDPLAEMGLVDAPSRRFNAYACTEKGLAFLKVVFPTALKALVPWIDGGSLPYRLKPVAEELDPTKSLQKDARRMLREAFLSGDNLDPKRRPSALAWVDAMRTTQAGHDTWDRRPTEITDERHWSDMRVGAHFSRVMAAAAGELEGGSVLDQVEARLGSAVSKALPLREAADEALRPSLDELRWRARVFLDQNHDPSPQKAARSFCKECANADDVELLRCLVARDGRILRLEDGQVRRGPAFRGRSPAADSVTSGSAAAENDSAEEAMQDAPMDDVPALPEGISFRIRNLYHLAEDLQ